MVSTLDFNPTNWQVIYRNIPETQVLMVGVALGDYYVEIGAASNAYAVKTAEFIAAAPKTKEDQVNAYRAAMFLLEEVLDERNTYPEDSAIWDAIADTRSALVNTAL